jgi:acetyl esterase/lipase
MEQQYMKMKDDWIAEMAASPGIPLWPEGKTPGFRPEYGQPEPSVVPFLLDKAGGPRGAVIVCPGGGYEFKAPHEGRPVARMLNAAGIHAFVLDYRVKPYRIESPLMDVQRAIRTVRARSAEWGVKPDRIGVLGFSAGGHLSIMASTNFDGGDVSSADPVERVSCRPDAQVPCYPAVPSAKDGRVSADTPPAFIWGTWDDFLYKQWPPYLKELRKNGIPFEFHLFPGGGHGMGLAEKNNLASKWPGLCAAWLKELEF